MTAWSRITETLLIAWRCAGMARHALWAAKTRSLFVVAGVALGIASLTIIVAAVDGAERKANEMVRIFGPDAVLVLGGNIESRAVGQRTLTLSYEDNAALRRALPGAYLVVPMRAKSNVQVRYGGQVTQVPLVVGTSEGYARAWDWPLSEGRDLSAEDLARSARVGLIGDTVSRELFGDASPIGRTVLMDRFPLQIVGRLSYRGVSGGSGSVDNRIIIPITTLTKRFNLDRKYFRALRVKFHNPEYMPQHVANLRSLLRHLHGLRPEQEDDFSILTADEVLKFLSTFKGGLVLFLGVTAVVAMVVGGFVLANLFYLGVDERRSEIGLKMALGAPRWAILVQILLEAVGLTLIGALLGMGLGIALGQLLARLGVLKILFSWKVFGFALFASLAIGLIFGLKPARRAASLAPIEALKGNG
ncbi:ABC transporter, membrane protein [Syntrophotalea carbinolica DSM 2380]|uniref:ABC transporter, membrane protein n=1 Tax=Syntrophotalea carbinolica (strain DSM 2380 / NBRC 103641 / GraBd1) TaxID=338963 RepID=Q39ZS5_SYNC1|nr:ABC transporter permease [Syntrophotalea carbinolica]ABA87529.1 ABC transporter, membrane protein [Syntrophotalea carbinolica DSM 2380]